MQPSIGLVDAAILATYLGAVVALGIYLGRGQRDVDGYLLGGRNLPGWAVLLSIVATETSTVTFLSIPGLTYRPGGSFVFLQLTLGYILGRLLVVLLFLPHYFLGELFTAYEVLQRRFGGGARQAASLLFLVTRNLGDGLRLFLSAIVMERMLGIDLAFAIVILGAATILYTFAGGIKSVVWNDCIQFFVYVGGALLAGIVLLALLGSGSTELSAPWAHVGEGWTKLVDFARTEDKLRLFDFSLHPATPYTLWSGIFGGVFVALATHGTDQLMVQRYLAARSRKAAAAALSLSGFIVAGQFALFLLIGVGLAAFYDRFPPAVAFTRQDQVFPAFIVDYLPAGAVGLIVAAVFAAAMSTLSSSLNSSASAAINDFYRPWRRQASAGELLRASRLATVLFGLVQIAVAVIGRRLESTVIESVMAIAGFVSGVVLGIFFLGTLTRRVGQQAALVGLGGGLAVMTAIVFGTSLAWPWYALVGSTLTFVIGLLASLFLPATQNSAGRESRAG